MKMRFYLLAGLLILSAVSRLSFADDDELTYKGRVPVPVITDAIKGDKCVEPTPVMRRNHMKFLLHKRDQTMHEGIRTKQYSLKECIACHVNKDDAGQSIPINAEGQFCDSCHDYAAVNIDCFQCHATTPEGGKSNLHGLEPHSSIAPMTTGSSIALAEQFFHKQ